MSKSSLSFILGSEAELNKSCQRVQENNTSTERTQPKVSLSLLQQPVHSKVTPRSHYNNRILAPLSEHRPIHPPPVLKLVINDFESSNDQEINKGNKNLKQDQHNFKGHQMDDGNYETRKVLEMLSNKRPLPKSAHYSTFFVTADIVDTDENNQNDSEGSSTSDERSSKTKSSILLFENDTLSGSKVSSGMHIKLPLNNSNNNKSGTRTKKGLKGVDGKRDANKRSYDHSICFVFGDISVRKLGKFRLLFKLYEFKNYKIEFKDQILSDVFTVYSQKKFPGAIPSTPLTKFLYKHGARIRQRKSKAELTGNSAPTSADGTATGMSTDMITTSDVMDENSDENNRANDKKRSFSFTNSEVINAGNNSNVANIIPLNKRYFSNSHYNFVNRISPIPFQTASPLPSPINPTSGNSSNYSPPVSPVFPYYMGSNSSSAYTSPGSIQLVSPVNATFASRNASGAPGHPATNYNYFQKPVATPYSQKYSLAEPSVVNNNSYKDSVEPSMVTVDYRQPIPFLNPPPKIRPSRSEGNSIRINSGNEVQENNKVRLSGISSFYKFSNNEGNNGHAVSGSDAGSTLVSAGSADRGFSHRNDDQKIKLPSLTGLNLLY